MLARSIIADVATPDASEGSALWVVVAIVAVLVAVAAIRIVVRRSRR